MKTISAILCLLVPFLGMTQTIEKFSIDSGGASATAGGIEILYTIGEVNVQELSAGNIQVSEGFINGSMKIKIDPKLFLQGPILNPTSAGLMNDDLRQNTLIPTTSPYADAAVCNASVFNVTGNNAIVDWVWVELRAANDNTKLINGKSALLQRDGDVVGLDGVSEVVMLAAPTSYYVVVKHRNHLGAMSASTITLNESTSTEVDFRNSGFSTFGSHAQVVLGSGDTALWSGDTNLSNQIKFSGAGNGSNTIKDYILSDPLNGFNSVTFSSSGYLNTDLNLNGLAKFSGAGNDSNIIKDNVLMHPSNGFNSPTFTINTTVPELD
ncbi:hemagglutinin protein [Lacinutrix iliipiscaria]|uniref:Hemagglutinin protein n=1 Tax=Lacinutrix iliipiscaria TaxID=1230532 RepID=A0ABW5WPC2_9FLAO